MLHMKFAIWLVAAAYVSAYPRYLLPGSPYIPGGNGDGTCTGVHPTGPIMRISFEIANTAGALTTAVCPGAAYTITVKFPEQRLALLTASTGAFTNPDPTTGCPNRVDLGGSSRWNVANSFTTTFEVPCNAAGGIQLKVTSAGRGTSRQWAQMDTTLTVSSACAVAKCGVQARPQYWADPVWRLVPELPPCTAHPERDYAELYAPHGSPIPDSTIVFTMYGKDNITATNTVCPGETHVFKVSFPQRRLALLTASLGAIVPHAGSISRVLDPNCPQRVDLGDSYYLNTGFTVEYTLPCNASDAGFVLFKVTSAPGAVQWRQSNVTLAVNTACASLTCDLRGGWCMRVERSMMR
ncbi:hypothetical protein HXX76_003560 [Chlamydomonas incerta]|uniref:Uncharacterized protein n=1 Tax=Chlamydomonas incerta TaxID=51695 RepID=A0A835TBN7_CHLIN|nr:hypothetical protein HXX76_003560 [Chlamydomonas incerta]|eukprot:KAG2440702.1 hypothetical protein HXX76_003560 [Chlamydomonas incerta]